MSHVLKDDTVMSKVHAPEEQEIETGRPLKEDSHYGPHLASTSFETSRPLAPGLPCSSQSTPSPSEGSGLLSLPWEMVTQIASHLPAQCVISVLPKVCQALCNVGEDSTSWQLRAGRLTGSRVRFPVGSREGYDWPNACLEMEDLITCWEDQAEWVDRHTKAREDRNQAVHEAEVRGGEERRGEADQDAEGFVFAERGVELGVDVLMEVALEGELEMQAEGQRANSKEKRRRRPEEAAAVVMVKEERCNERGSPEALECRGSKGANPQLGGGGAELGVVEAEPLRPLSPPPALERVPLPSTGHYAQVNSVLLTGGEGAVCVSGSRDTNVILWDLHGGRDAVPCMLRGQGLTSSHRGWVWCLASQGPLLASGSFDSTIRLWDLGAGGAERGLISTSAPVLCLSCQPDVLLAGTFNKTISLYDTRLAEPLVKSLQLHGKAVMCLAADEQYIISGSQDYTVAIYDRRAGKTLKRLRQPSCVAIKSNFNFYLVDFYTWDLKCFSNPSFQLRSYLLSMCYQNGEVWAGDNKGTIHAFSVQSGVLEPLSQFDVGHTSLVTGIHKSPGSLYTSSSDRTLKVHIPCAPPRTLCTLNYQEGVSGLSVESGVLAVASGETSVEVWRPSR